LAWPLLVDAEITPSKAFLFIDSHSKVLYPVIILYYTILNYKLY